MSSSISRRKFLRNSMYVAGATGVALQTGVSSAMAQAAPAMPPVDDGLGRVNIGSNTLSEGPSKAAVEAAARQIPLTGSYGGVAAAQFVPTLAKQLGVPQDYISVYPGSGTPLDLAVMSFVSPGHALVTADPSYEQGWRTAPKVGAEVVKVPQRKDYSHDVEAMCAADPAAGVIYICNPNNPTGAITTRQDIEYAVANKPKGSVLIVDEAYIDFSHNAVTAADLTLKDDVIVLRTFSKLYGMAGLRLGYAVARPELLKKMNFRGGGSVAATTFAAGLASISDESLVPQRRAYYGKQRTETVAWLEKQGYACSISESNCFLVDVKEDGREFARKVATYGVNIGRTWPGFETWPRVSVGTEEEMQRFRDAFAAVKAGKLGPLPLPEPRRPRTAMLEDGRDAIGYEHSFEVC